jgi:hypothetical protein
MFLMYVDESGDSGLIKSPTNFFALSAIVIHESHWYETLDKIVSLRKHLKDVYDLKIREEIHTSGFINHPKSVSDIPKYKRLLLLKEILQFEAKLDWIRVINVVVDKTNKPGDFDVFAKAWDALFQRFDNTLYFGNFPDGYSKLEHGMVVTDATDGKKLKLLLRRKRRYNPVPFEGGNAFRMLPVKHVIEDPVERDSADSYLIQLADVNAYFLHQKSRANAYIAKKGARNYFDILDPILLKVANKRHPQGIVNI